jgi:hypothetical protein
MNAASKERSSSHFYLMGFVSSVLCSSFIRSSAKAWFPTAEGDSEQRVKSSDAPAKLCRSAVHGERGTQHERLAVLHHLQGVSQASQRTFMELLYPEAILAFAK